MNGTALDLKKYYAGINLAPPPLPMAFRLSVSVPDGATYQIGQLPPGASALYKYGDGESETISNSGSSNLAVYHEYAAGDYVLEVDAVSGAVLSFKNNLSLTGILETDRNTLTASIEGTDLFCDCSNLELDDTFWSMARPDLRTIGVGAFQSTKAAFTYIPGSVSSIMGSAFQGSFVSCSQLPPYLSYLGLYAFAETPVTISELPQYCWTCEDGPFLGCSGVTSMTFPTGISFNRQPLQNTPVTSVYFKGQWTSNATSILRQINGIDIYVAWGESDPFNAHAPWGARNAVMHYDWNPNA